MKISKDSPRACQGSRRLPHGLAVVPLCCGVLAAALMAASCQGQSEDAVPGAEAKQATIRVEAGNGRLAGGEEFAIAEWRSGGAAGQGGYFSHFRGQDGGPSLDFSLTGLKAVGTFSCSGGGAGSASLELRVDVNNVYRAATDAPCRVVVERVRDGQIVGHYMAVLRHAGNPYDEMAVSGEFRATLPAPEVEAAKAPKIGLR